MERITVHKNQLIKSRTLHDGGFYVLVLDEWPDEEQVFLGLCSEPKNTEQEAIDQLQKLEELYASAMKGDKVYVLGGEMKVWHEGPHFVAYEQICFPGVGAEKALQIRAIT